MPAGHSQAEGEGGGEGSDSIAAEEASELGIPVALASRLTPSMLDELRRAPRKRPTLEEQRKQFEAQRELENFDPLQHDPVEQVRPTRGPQPLAVHPKRGPRLVTDPSPR